MKIRQVKSKSFTYLPSTLNFKRINLVVARGQSQDSCLIPKTQKPDQMLNETFWSD